MLPDDVTAGKFKATFRRRSEDSSGQFESKREVQRLNPLMWRLIVYAQRDTMREPSTEQTG
jgi:hypothetical protein